MSEGGWSETSDEMSFKDFLALMRKEVGNYCSDKYWEYRYQNLEYRTERYIRNELPYMAICAIATDYTSRRG